MSPKVDFRRGAPHFECMKTLHWLLLVLVGLPIISSAADSSGADKAATPESFQIRNRKYHDLLRPKDANNATGTPIVLYSPQPWKCMTWKFHPAGESTFQLQNHFTSKTFAADTTAASPANPAVHQVPFGKSSDGRPSWKFTKLDDGAYQIMDPKSGQALTATSGADGIRIVLAPWSGREEQKWDLLKIDPRDLTM